MSVITLESFVCGKSGANKLRRTSYASLPIILRRAVTRRSSGNLLAIIKSSNFPSRIQFVLC